MRKRIFIVFLSLLALISGNLHSALCETVDLHFNFPIPSPQNLTVAVGDSVRFSGDGPSDFHPLRQVDGPASDTPISGGFASTMQPYVVPFDTPGVYYYQCAHHGLAANGGTMRGSITVVTCNGKPDKPVLTVPATGARLTGLRVTLDWDDTPCATRYMVTVKKGKTLVDHKTVTKSTYKTIKLSKNSKYTWNVKACNASGCGGAASSSFSLK